MAEAHTVYRVERSAKWDQRLPATPMRSLGPVLGIREPSSRPIPESESIRTERERQAKLSDEIATAQQRMTALEKELRVKLVQYDDSTTMVKKIQTQLKILTAEKDAALAELDQSRKQLAEAEERITMLEMTQSDTLNFDDFSTDPAP